MKTFLRFFLFLGMLFSLIPGNRAEGKTRWGFSVSIGRPGMGFPEPVWLAADLREIVRRYQKDVKEKFEKEEKIGGHNAPPPVNSFPHWARCQELALKLRPDIVFVRMNLAGVKAALSLLKGDFSDLRDDNLSEGLPSGFSARDWGEEILGDFQLRGCSKGQVSRILSAQVGGIRELFMDLRDEINRDIVWDHHSWERATRGNDPADKNRQAWKVWRTLGFPDRL